MNSNLLCLTLEHCTWALCTPRVSLNKLSSAILCLRQPLNWRVRSDLLKHLKSHWITLVLSRIDRALNRSVILTHNCRRFSYKKVYSWVENAESIIKLAKNFDINTQNEKIVIAKTVQSSCRERVELTRHLKLYQKVLEQVCTVVKSVHRCKLHRLHNL